MGCTAANSVQVYAVIDITDRIGKAWPGPAGQDLRDDVQNEIGNLALDRCGEQYKQITGKDFRSLPDKERVGVHEPTSDTDWRLGGGHVVCTSHKVILPEPSTWP